MYRIVTIGVLAAVLAQGGINLSRAQARERRSLTAFFQEYLDGHFRRRPLDATRLGDHRFDHLLDDLSPKARSEWVDFTRRTLDALRKDINYKNLARDEQIDHEILESHLRSLLWLAENTRPFETDPRMYNEFISDSVFLLLTQSTLPMPENIKNCAARMARIPGILAAARSNLRNPARVMLETAIRQNQGAIAFYESGIYEISGETPRLSELASPARAAVAALKEYQKYLERDLARRADGNWRLGRAKFRRKLELELDAGVTAEEVVRDARQEAARVTNEMYVIARQLWAGLFASRPLPPDDDAGRRTTIRLVMDELGKDHGKVEALVADVKRIVAELRSFISKHDILRLPDPDRCTVFEMPEFQRGNSTAYLNPAPPLDPKARSMYAVSPPPRHWDTRRVSSYLSEYNRHMLHILSIHEAYPGHYVQLEYSNRHPSLIRRVLSSGVFAEGWAVYTEQMMLDQGYGLVANHSGAPRDGTHQHGGMGARHSGLALRLHQLKFYLRAVINAILDYQMHCEQMSDEEALKMLVDGGFQTEGEALGKIIRAKQSSCQLSTYFVGRMAFYRLRQQIQREMGEKFDLGRFHEAVLAHGTLPVKYLPELVRARLALPR